MADITTLHRDRELEARLNEEAREDFRNGDYIAGEDVVRWLRDWKNGVPDEILLAVPASRPKP